ncbi:PLP-dependent aminotransferase family protein [Enterovirga rhinocerotis]|uniref:8-amino-7-oxononanoate synthase n=1 Tax=Enterovirga rhinocerotis TaxID=1339210 RepID=A0A4R7BWV3_9HYPH|nr:PLP-dependent aminotransferase family protein [Enterovirga rhinocerotis]TDR90390.1 GntR family transcriptional regulator [Enterovirga rhinocerotis]
MAGWLPELAPGDGPKYAAIARSLTADIEAGRLRPGQRLPAQRALAQALGIDLTTVTRAFNEVRRAGLIKAGPGRGSFVRAPSRSHLVGAREAPLIDMSMNVPPCPPEARLPERLSEGVARLMRSREARLHLTYQDSAGTAAVRNAGAHWTSERFGIPTDPMRVVVAPGAQAALAAILKVAVPPGRTLCVPAATYPGLLAAAAQQACALAPIEMDRDGLVPDAFEAACRRVAPAALYCVPTLDNPTTATLPLARREAIVRIARAHGVAIIEDDAYGALAVEPPPAFAALAPDLTWHVATVSKCLTPSLRVAWVAAPSLTGALDVSGTLRAATMMASPVLAQIAADWLLDGTLGQILQAIRHETILRQALAGDILAGYDVASHPEAYHLWLRLPPGWSGGDLAARAGLAGLAIVPDAAFSTMPGRGAVRVSLGAAPDRGKLADGLRLIAALLARPPSAMSAIV